MGDLNYLNYPTKENVIGVYKSDDLILWFLP